MTTVLFYQKPGCATNARQIRALEAAGHSVIAKDLLTEPWTDRGAAQLLRRDARVLLVQPAAPRIKSGEVEPDSSDADGALALMLADPLLIRRPLVEANGTRCAGFDREPVLSLLGQRSPQNLHGCSREGTGTQCPSPESP